MVTIEELKLGNKTLEALKFLLLQINELDVILNELNFEELREANNQAKTQIEVLNNIKTLVLNTEKSIEQVKVSIDSRSEEINTTKREIEDAKTNIIKAKDDTTLIYENISSKSERIEQKYNEIGEIKKGVDRKFDDIKTIEEQSRDMANEITNNKNIILKKIDENINTLNNTISNINILKNETLQEIATTKAGIDTKANEALNTATSSLNEIKTILNDFKGKQAELNALKASLETLKNSLENLNKSGLINDTQAGIAQTYSSNKINNLLQGVLRESDASESNANGKLVKRNAQGNIYATNVYLNATTKAEVSDIKASLATDKWRFIVRDTGEGLLRSMSIKDFISSQEVDAYKKSEADNLFVTKTSMNTILAAKVDFNMANKPNGYPQLDTSSKIATEQLPANINAKTLDGKASSYYASAFYLNTEITNLRNLVSQTQGNLYYKVDKSTILEGNTDKIKMSALPDNMALLKDRKLELKVIPVDEGMQKENTNSLTFSNFSSRHFEITLLRQDIFTMYAREEQVGRTGVIVFKGAKKISGWSSNVIWREVPTDLKDVEVMAYFVAAPDKIYMGRA